MCKTPNNRSLSLSLSLQQLNLEAFNRGNYQEALAGFERAETLTSILYPNDNTPDG